MCNEALRIYENNETYLFTHKSDLNPLYKDIKDSGELPFYDGSKNMVVRYFYSLNDLLRFESFIVRHLPHSSYITSSYLYTYVHGSGLDNLSLIKFLISFWKNMVLGSSSLSSLKLAR